MLGATQDELAVVKSDLIKTAASAAAAASVPHGGESGATANVFRGDSDSPATDNGSSVAATNERATVVQLTKEAQVQVSKKVLKKVFKRLRASFTEKPGSTFHAEEIVAKIADELREMADFD